MKWSEIDEALRRQAIAVAGYNLIIPALDGRRLFQKANSYWGWTGPGHAGDTGYPSEAGAVDGAFAHLCRTKQVMRHKKGGIYMTVGVAKHTGTGEEVMVYDHLAPHEKGTWVRELAEFDEPGRFVRIEA